LEIAMRLLSHRRPLALGLVTAVLFASQLGAEAEDAKPKVKAEINPAAVAALLRAGVSVVVLDARGNQDTFLPKAKPLKPDAPASSVRRTVPRKASLIVTYDQGADDEAGQALAERLYGDGYKNVIRFPGGVDGWRKAGFKLRKKLPPPAPVRSGGGSRGSGSRR
jgi:rhodanese-related sulfurtransferase